MFDNLRLSDNFWCNCFDVYQFIHLHGYRINLISKQKEPCGLNKNYGFKQCDDGNINNGDGCSATCNIEPGYTCFGGDSTQPDTCVRSAPAGTANPQMKFEQYSMGKILIYFDQPMIIKKPIEQLINLTMPDNNGFQFLKGFSFQSLGNNGRKYNMFLVTWIPYADYSFIRLVII